MWRSTPSIARWTEGDCAESGRLAEALQMGRGLRLRLPAIETGIRGGRIHASAKPPRLRRRRPFPANTGSEYEQAQDSAREQDQARRLRRGEKGHLDGAQAIAARRNGRSNAGGGVRGNSVGRVRRRGSRGLGDDDSYEEEGVASKTTRHENVSGRVGAAQTKIAQLEAAVKEDFKASAAATGMTLRPGGDYFFVDPRRRSCHPEYLPPHGQVMTALTGGCGDGDD